jgi:hypothetical protein
MGTPETERARRTADEIRGTWPEKAAEIDAAIAEIESGQREDLNINVGYRFRLEKFDGDATAGQAPVEVIEGEGTL